MFDDAGPRGCGAVGSRTGSCAFFIGRHLAPQLPLTHPSFPVPFSFFFRSHLLHGLLQSSLLPHSQPVLPLPKSILPFVFCRDLCSFFGSSLGLLVADSLHAFLHLALCLLVLELFFT